MRAKILIVDDSASIRALVKLILGTQYDFVEAVNGAEGCEKASREQPQLILLDVQMPVKDGLAALQTLKSTPETHQIPVLMVSTLAGDAESDNMRTAKSLGAAGFVGKPIGRDALAQAVQEQLSGAGS